MSHAMVLSRSAQKRLSRQIAAITAQSSLNEEREPNGRLSRKIIDREARMAMTEQEAKSVAIEARIRHGVDPAYADLSDAGRPNAGTVHGRMCLARSLSLEQWTAAEFYLGTRLAYLRSIEAQLEVSQPAEGGTGTDESYVEWCQAIGERWREVVKRLQEVSTMSRSPVLAAFDVILVRGQLMPHMDGDLRLGLNAIHTHFLAQRRAAS